jgi:nitroreductase
MISALIRSRRSVYPKNYDTTRPVARTTIVQLLENANWAPTHRLTEPWRFIVFHSLESRIALGEYLAEAFKSKAGDADFPIEKYEKTKAAPVRAGAVIAIVLQRDPEQRVPEWEELAATAMAVQNMWLTCTELGLGCYWSTPKAALEADVFMGLSAGQQCLGLFYIGWHNLPELAGKRGDAAEKTRWR